MSEEEDTPAWLDNAVMKPQKSTKAPKRVIKTKKVAKVLKEAGLTVVIKDGTETEIVDVEVDPDECWDQMKKWSEGTALSESARALRNAFVLEFIKDFNGIRAATRCGAKDPVALWRRMERCAYVQRSIGRALDKWEAGSMVTRDNVVAGLWRESNDFISGNAASRVSALSKLAKVMGMEVDNINVNVHRQVEFVDAPLTREEFNVMRIAFEEEF